MDAGQVPDARLGATGAQVEDWAPSEGLENLWQLEAYKGYSAVGSHSGCVLRQP